MRWKRSSDGTVRFKLFGRWGRRDSYHEEVKEETAKKKGGIFAFLVRRSKNETDKRKPTLTESEEHLDAWTRRRDEYPGRRHVSMDHNPNDWNEVPYDTTEKTRILKDVKTRKAESRHLTCLGKNNEEENVWKTRLLKQEGDIENLTGVINHLRGQLGKKNAECLELRRDMERMEPLRQKSKSRSSIISQDESFQTVIFPGQAIRRSSLQIARRRGDTPVVCTSLKTRHTATQTEVGGTTDDMCPNESCKIQLLKIKRESNSLKMQLAEGEDIILGLELDHDALRKYLTQTELKLQRTEEEVVTLKRSLGDQEKHYNKVTSGYDDRINSLKVQNDKLNSKLLSLMNRSNRTSSECIANKREVGVQVVTQVSLTDGNMFATGTNYNDQGVKPRRGRQVPTPVTMFGRYDKDRAAARRAQCTPYRGVKGQFSNINQARETKNITGNKENQCVSTDDSLEYEMRRRNRMPRKSDILEREDSGLETDRSCISAENDHYARRKMSGVLNEPYCPTEQVLHEETRTASNNTIDDQCQRPRQGVENESDWRKDIMLQLNYLESFIERKQGSSNQEKTKRLERRRTVAGGRAMGQSQQISYRQSWHEQSVYHNDVPRPAINRQRTKTPSGTSHLRAASTESTDEENGHYHY